jgi:hypothetical protein
MAYDDVLYESAGAPVADWRAPPKDVTEQGKDEPGFLGDLGRATVAGAYGVASALGGAGEYLQGGAEQGSLSTQLREFGNEGAEAWAGSMSKRGQRELRAGVIEGDTIWDQGVSGAVRSLALKTGSSIPSLVASVLPGGLVARALGATAGTVAGGSVAAGISGGGVFGEIQSGILKSPDAQLQSQSELYAELRARGMSEDEAKRELVDFAAGSKPLIMAAITAGTSAFGLEGFVAGLMAGGGRKGIAASALRGATGEAAQEFIESGTESILTQQGKVDTNRASEINWLEVLDKALEGAAVGGVLGGAVGGVLGRGEREQTPPPADPTQPGAKPGETPPPADIAVNPELEEDVDIEEEAPVATSPAVDPDQQVAIAAATQTAAPAAPAELDTNALIEEVRGELASVRAGIETLGPEGVSSAEQAALQPDTITPQIDEVKTQLRQVRDQIPPAAANEVQPPVAPVQPTLATPEAGKSLELSQTPQAPVARLTPEAAPVEPASPPPEPQAPAPVKQPTLRRGAAVQNKVGGEADADAVEGYGAPAWMKYVARTAKAMGEAAPQAVRDANDRLAEREKLPKRDPRKKRYDAELEQLRQQYVAELRQRDKARRESFERADAGGDSDTEIKARDVISRFEPAAAETNKKIGEGARRKAVQARFEQIVKAAAEAGIKIPTKGTPNEAPHIGALRYYNRMAKAIAAGRLSALNHSNTVDEILGTDALVRGGNPEAAAELISVEDGRAAARAGADENTLSDEQAREVEVQRTQRDAARAGEDEANVTDEVNPNAVEEVAADDNPQDEAEAEEYLVEVGLAQPVARVAPAPDEDDGPAYRAFQAPKRVAAVEVSRKRSIKPKAEAAKDVSRAKVTPQVKPTITKPAAPTEAQKEAGNYRKQHLDVQGLPVTIETAKGQERSGTAPDGTRWAVKMPADYGYVKRTRGADGDQIDVYLGSDRSSDVVVLIDQKDLRTGKFDEHKAMLGFKAVADAVEAYSKGFSDGRAQERVQDVTVMTMAEFKEWLRVPQTKPASTQGVGDVVTESAPTPAPEWAQKLADDVGGVVPYHSGDLALIQGFSALNGKLIFSAAKKGVGRTRVDVESYTGKDLTEAEVAELRSVANELRASDTALHESAPNGPFSAGQVARSDGIDPRMAEVFEGWLRMLGIKSRVFLTTPGDMRAADAAQKHNLYGPYAPARSVVLLPDGGTARRLSNGDYTVSVNPLPKKAQSLEILAHEMGHIIEKEALANADVGTRNALHEAFSAWMKSKAGLPAREYTGQLRPYLAGKNVTGGDGLTMEQLTPYWRSFSEWFADQSAKWAMTADRPATVVDRFFAKIGAAYRKLASALFPDRQPVEAVRAYLDGLVAQNPQFATGWDVVEASLVTADVIPQYATAPQTIAGYVDASADLVDLDPRRQQILRLLGSTLKRLTGDVPVRIVTYEEMSRDPLAVQAMESGRVSSVPGGYYSPANREIVLLDTRLQTHKTAFDLFVHEALHAATSRAIYASDKHRGQIRAMMDALDADLRKLSEFTGEPYQRPYGLTNEDEFISEAFSNRSFQERLMRAEAPASVLAELRGDQPKGFTLWRGFVAMVKRMLGFNVVPDSLFEGAVLVTEQLLQTKMAGPWKGSPRDALPMFAAPPTGAARTEATGGWFKQFGYRFAHLEYLGQRASGLFTYEGKDQLRRLIDAVQRIQPKSRAIADEGHKLAAEEIELRRKDPAMAEAKAQLGVDVTTLNVNLVDRAGVTKDELLAANLHLGKDAVRGWQAKANLAQLQKRFEALSPEARALWARQTKYYRDTQNRIIEAELRTLMSSLGDKLTPAQVDDFVKRTMAGTLTDDDGKVLGKTIYDGLSRLPAFRRLEGTYFPLMRHGSQVVQTLLKLGDLKGGKLIGKNVVEFRAADDKEARKLARIFASDTDVPVTQITRTFYLRSTGEQLSALNATGQDVDVAYRVRLNRDGVFFFDDRTQAERFRRQSAGDYEQVSETMPVADYNHNMELTNTQMASLMRSVNARDDVNDAQKALIQVTLRQAAARMASGNRIAKRTIKRQGNVGASTDMGRSLIRYGEAAGGYLAKSEYMPEVQDALRLMRKVAAASTYSPRRGDMSMILNDVEARIKGNVEQYADPNAFVQTMLQLSFLDKLFSPAYSIINAMQPAMVTLPWLSGRYGATRAVAYLSSAYRSIGMGDVLGGGIGNTFVATKSFNRAALDTSDLLGSIKKRLSTQSDGKQLIGVLEMLQERGALDDGAVFELSSNVASGQGPTRTFLARVDRVARQLPAAVEQMNRSVTAIAAYRLAYSQSKDAEAASKAAYEAVMMTQFDYSNANSSTFFTSQSGLMRFALQFRKYAANMSVLLYDMARQATKGATPEERRVARKQLTALAAVQVTMAGALSLPGLELVKLLAMAVAAATGGGGYDDIERYLRRTLEQSMGQTGMEALLKGLPRAAGIDISTRVSLADMWTFGEPREYKRENLQAYVLGMVLGAPGGLAFDWIEAMQHAGRGEMGKAIEKAFPVKFIADTVKGAKAMDDGYVGPAGAAAQALGFRPSALSRRAEEVGDRIAARKDMEREKKDLEREYQNASTAGERAKVMSKIRQFNQRDDVGRNRISTQWMDKAREERRVRRGDPVEATR